MMYRFRADFKGGRSLEGSFSLDNMPGNCRYNVLTYCSAYGDGTLEDAEKTFIAESILKYVRDNHKRMRKFLLSAKTVTGNPFDTIDFIKYNDLLLGTEVPGAYGGYNTVSAEFDIQDVKEKHIETKVEPLKGAKIKVDEANGW